MADDGEVLVYRNPETGRPVAVPGEVVTQAEREYRAYQSRLAGKSWDIIAMEEQWPSGDAAAAAVQRYLREGKAVVGEFRRREALAMEMARLDALQAALWPGAMEGRIAAVNMSLNVIKVRMSLLGLDQVTEDDESGARETVIVPADSSGYAAALQRVAEGE